MFVALVPPAEAVEDLDAFLEPRREAGRDLRWSAPEQVHVTLAFCGQVSKLIVAIRTAGSFHALSSHGLHSISTPPMKG